MRDMKIDAMIARMDELMAQFRTTFEVEPVPGPSGFVDKRAFASVNPRAIILANPQRESTYEPMAFPPLL